MKIEMGESLFYSWLRHIKGCQVVQTNWKASPQWPLGYREELEAVKEATDRRRDENVHFRPSFRTGKQDGRCTVQRLRLDIG